MSIFSIHHVTRYDYSRPVRESLNQVKIHPYICNEQEILQHELNITNHPSLHLFPDYWGNRTAIFNIAASHHELVIDSRLTIRVKGRELSFLHEDFIPDSNIAESIIILAELKQPEFISNQKEIERIAREVYSEEKSLPAIIQDCNEYIFSNFQYIKGITDFDTTVDEILDHKSGVCQDFAHVLLQLLRSLNIACRYVSGYICPNKNGMRGEGATHAWVEAWIPGYGWAGIDPTNNVWVQNNHVKLAVGRDFKDCTPAKGLFKGVARQVLSVYVSVGYEDGHTFEEINKVTMESEQHLPVLDDEPIYVPGHDQQQQQQQ